MPDVLDHYAILTTLINWFYGWTWVLKFKLMFSLFKEGTVVVFSYAVFTFTIIRIACFLPVYVESFYG
jgi:hypothetical protein